MAAREIGRIQARVNIDKAPEICRRTEDPTAGLKLGDDLGSKFRIQKGTIKTLNGRLLMCADLWDDKVNRLR